MQWDMGEVKETINKVTNSLVKMKEGNEERDRKNETRDKKLDDLITSLSTSLVEREKEN